MSDASIAEVEYRLVPGYDGAYRVGDDGSVWSRSGIGAVAKRGELSSAWKKLKLHKTKSGYLMAYLHTKGCMNRLLVHRLILECFVGSCPDGMQCRHFPDKTKSNNRLDNLSWGTPKENQADRVAQGTHLKGNEINLAKLTDELVIRCRERAAAGIPCKQMAKELGVARGTLVNAVAGVTWKHIPNPYTGMLRPKAGQSLADQIRIELQKGTKARIVAVQFGVSEGTVSLIKNNRTYKNG